jgi:hypothetical protein
MNFENMPELRTRWGYFVVMFIMACLAAAMLIFFYRKGWLSSLDARRRKPRPLSSDLPLMDANRHPLTQPTTSMPEQGPASAAAPPLLTGSPRPAASRPAMPSAARAPAAQQPRV